MKQEKVIFLDRDGTINEEVRYLHRKEDLRFLEGVPEALRRLKHAGYRLIIVTNQAGVARGYYGEDAVRELHVYMNELLAAQGAQIDAFFYCPHHPEAGISGYGIRCDCRKPQTGMFEQAARQFEIDKSASWMIGDKRIDAEAGKRFGVHTILVGTGYGAEEHEKQRCEGSEPPYEYYADTLSDAVGVILSH